MRSKARDGVRSAKKGSEIYTNDEVAVTRALPVRAATTRPLLNLRSNCGTEARRTTTGIVHDLDTNFASAIAASMSYALAIPINEACRSDRSQDLPRDARPRRIDANTPDYPQVALAYACKANLRCHNEVPLREQCVSREPLVILLSSTKLRAIRKEFVPFGDEKHDPPRLGVGHTDGDGACFRF